MGILSLFVMVGVAVATPPKFVAVTGHCQKQVTPDRAGLNLTAEVREANAGDAASKVTKQYERLRIDIKKLNLKDQELQTSNYQVRPEFDYSNGKQKLKGYVASLGIELETSEISRIGEVIELATKNGVQNAGGFRTFLSQGKEKETHEGCLEEAIRNARSKAEKMAKAGGTRLGEVLTIEEFKNLIRPPEPPMMMDAMAGAAKAMAAPGIETRSLPTDVTVYVSFALQ